MRRAATLLAVLVGAGVGAARPAPADDLAAEGAFLDERFESGGLVSASDYPGFLLSSWWRPDGSSSLTKGGSALDGRRRSWNGLDAYPMPGAGEADSHPLLTALVLDRIRREQQGARGLPDESPLAAIGDARVRWFLQGIMRPAFLGAAAAEKPPDQRDHERQVLDVAARNRWIAAATLVGLLLAVGAALRLTRPRASPLAAG